MVVRPGTVRLLARISRKPKRTKFLDYSTLWRTVVYLERWYGLCQAGIPVYHMRPNPKKYSPVERVFLRDRDI